MLRLIRSTTIACALALAAMPAAHANVFSSVGDMIFSQADEGAQAFGQLASKAGGDMTAKASQQAFSHLSQALRLSLDPQGSMSPKQLVEELAKRARGGDEYAKRISSFLGKSASGSVSDAEIARAMQDSTSLFRQGRSAGEIAGACSQCVDQFWRQRGVTVVMSSNKSIKEILASAPTGGALTSQVNDMATKLKATVSLGDTEADTRVWGLLKTCSGQGVSTARKDLCNSLLNSLRVKGQIDLSDDSTLRFVSLSMEDLSDDQLRDLRGIIAESNRGIADPAARRAKFEGIVRERLQGSGYEGKQLDDMIEQLRKCGYFR